MSSVYPVIFTTARPSSSGAGEKGPGPCRALFSNILASFLNVIHVDCKTEPADALSLRCSLREIFRKSSRTILFQMCSTVALNLEHPLASPGDSGKHRLWASPPERRIEQVWERPEGCIPNEVLAMLRQPRDGIHSEHIGLLLARSTRVPDCVAFL